MYLRLRGHRILARDLRTPHAQIDILARRGPFLIVVEVKSRRGVGEVFVMTPQRKRLVRAAQWIHGRHGVRGSRIRIDTVAVEFVTGFPWLRVHHQQNVFGEEALED